MAKVVGRLHSAIGIRDHVIDGSGRANACSPVAVILKLNPPLPEDFLKRWIQVANEKPITAEEIEAEFEEYAKGIKWQIIQNHIIDAHDIEVDAEEIKAEYEKGSAMPVELHDGSKIVLRKVDENYDPTSRAISFKYLRDHFNAGEITTGLLYIDESRKEMHDLMGNTQTPLCELPLESLHPGADELKKIQNRYR